MTTPIRLYSFVNTTYMRPIQFGIQSTHLIGQALVPKYTRSGSTTTAASATFMDWCNSTEAGYVEIRDGVCLGRQTIINSIIESCCPILGLPHGKYHESDEALGGIMTITGFIARESDVIDPKDLRQMVPPICNNDIDIIETMAAAARAAYDLGTSPFEAHTAKLCLSYLIASHGRAR